MDVIQILVFLGIIGWGLFQARTQKQKHVRTVSQIPSAASLSVGEVIPEEVPVTARETRKKQKYTSVKSSIPKEQALNVPKEEEQKLGIAFRNASDARRAFVYSEIFCRKYD